MKTYNIILPIFLLLFSAASIHQLGTQHIADNADHDLGGAYLIFAGKHGGTLSPADIAKVKSLEIAGCAAGSAIMTFTLHVTRHGIASAFEDSSAVLSSEILSKLRELTIGDFFEFSDVTAKLPTGGIVDVWAKKFTVI